MSIGSTPVAVEKITKVKKELQERFSVERIGVFGSSVKGEETESSDVDILGELAVPTFYNYMYLKYRLEELLQLQWIWSRAMQ